MLNKLNISPQRQILIVYVVLVIVTLAVFWQVKQFNFINYDDGVYVTHNSHIQSGITLDGIRWAFSTRYVSLWNPLVWLSLMFDYQLHGLNAGGYHLTNLILHVMSVLLLFWLFNRMTGAIWKSAFVAAIFALHPLHVESVAWIAERKDVLSAFFWMLTLCLYVYYTEKPVIRRYLLVLLCFTCALMSKPMVITLPIVMILLDYWPLDRLQSDKKKLSETKIAGIIPLWQLKEKIPFFILSAVMVIITLYNPNTHDMSDTRDLQHYSLISRLANAPVAFVTYLEKTFWPHNMAVFYPFSDQIPLWQVLGASLLILVISVAVIIMMKRLPYLFTGWMWYAITIAPVIGIIQISITAPYAMADRYHYLPSIGLAVMMAWGIPALIKSEAIRKKLLFPAGIFFLGIISFISWNQCGYWKNSATLFYHALQVTKDNALAHHSFGLSLFKKGKIEEAIDHFNEAIRLKPDYAGAYYNRGIAYGKLGQHQRAIEGYTEAILLKPDDADAYNNRGNAYAELGQNQRAIEDYTEAIRLKPDDADAYNNRGNAYAELGQHQPAIEDYTEAIRLKPDDAKAYNFEGKVYTKLGQYQRAIADYNKAIRIKPDYADAYNNRGVAYLLQGNKELGCPDAQKACALGNCKILEMAKGKGDCR
jgi:tetratricopeptide (TPR) repeat protein